MFTAALPIAIALALTACAPHSAPSGDSAYAGGVSAADGGIHSTCRISADCGQSETCIVYCKSEALTQGCHTPAPTALTLGEPCTGGSCREGLCAAGGGKLPPARCVAFCVSDTDCATGERCETRDITYSCETSRAKYQLAVCLPAS